MARSGKRIKILYTIPNFDTAGSGKALLNVASRLNASLFEVHIACLHDKGEFFEDVEASGIPVHILKFTTPMKPYYKGVWNCYKISRELKSIKPDIIHSMHYASDYSEPLAAKMAGIKWVYTKKNMNWGGSSKNAWRLRTMLAKAVVVHNTDMARSFFLNSKKTHFIPRGVDTISFDCFPDRDGLRDKWSVKFTDRIIVCIANLTPIKGMDVLIRAFKLVCNDYSEWKLFIVGNNTNSYGKALITLTQTLGIDKQVIFCGRQLDVVPFLNLAECSALPTLEKGEGSPVALLEAMACGLNVLGSNVPGIKDILKLFPENLVTAGDIDAWSKALKAIFHNSTQENKMKGMAFRNHVLQNYDIAKEVSLCKKMYLDSI